MHKKVYNCDKCGAKTFRIHAPAKGKECLCATCRAAQMKEYQANHRAAHREEARIYQRKLTLKRKREQRKAIYHRQYAKTEKKSDRPEIQDVYNPSLLMRLSPEKLEKAISRISTGVADFVGSR